MKASERLQERNDLLVMIGQCDSELVRLQGEEPKSFRNAQLARELLSQRAELENELHSLGCYAPPITDDRDGSVCTVTEVQFGKAN